MTNFTSDSAGRLQTITVPAFFDTHVHFRQGQLIKQFVPWTALCCDRAVVMPNTKPPITTGDHVLAYRQEILDAVPAGLEFNPLMTLYLTPEMRAHDITAAKKTAGDALVGVKIYPRGGTTNSGAGIPISWLTTYNQHAPEYFADVLRAIADNNLVLNIHGENPDAELINREDAFMFCNFVPDYCIRTGGRAVLEHVSSGATIRSARPLSSQLPLACGITLHHLYHTLDNTYAQVHNCCWPAPLFPSDRTALCGAARLASPNVFLGSDSAPHPLEDKYTPHASCGCFTSPQLAQKLTEFFFADIEDKEILPFTVQRFVQFTSRNAENFYGHVAKPTGREISLKRQRWYVPGADFNVMPWCAGAPVEFTLTSSKNPLEDS